ncbi:PRC-barrel domain containing protein [Mesorhizobium sp. B2-4-19]|uniref:PRC-barrel domain-containing protein n=1 Tax=Mesorhizobium sp. B2-4-19 TaxID=2589930 RepID=UPI001127F513|nr:PRC-barrel domain-containing protein [Mesorhizobium sp. B2-4-19]TPK66550.1 PRC-barrel domain containing protein [Mesorhizobium sp. B2-4-19]
MDHANHARLTSTELTPDILADATIYDADDNKVGTVSHVHGSGAASQVVIDVGGFLGIGAKPVAVPASQLDFMRDEDGDVHAVTNWTKDQLKKMPEHHDA